MLIYMKKNTVIMFKFDIAGLELPIPVSYLRKTIERAGRYLTIDSIGAITCHNKRPRIIVQGLTRIWATQMSLIDDSIITGEYLGQIDISKIDDYDCEVMISPFTKTMLSDIRNAD